MTNSNPLPSELFINRELSLLEFQRRVLDEALDEQNLFTRFGKMQQSENSTGLGLAIVKAIADLYSFSVSYNYDQKHMITINFS